MIECIVTDDVSVLFVSNDAINFFYVIVTNFVSVAINTGIVTQSRL